MYAKEISIDFEEERYEEVCCFVYYGDLMIGRLWFRRAFGYSPYCFRSAREWKQTTDDSSLEEVAEALVYEIDYYIQTGQA